MAVSLKDPITLDDYDLDKAQRIIVERVFKDYPDDTLDKIAIKLNVNLRTVHRYLKQYNIIRNQKEIAVIEKLKQRGYTIIPPHTP